MSASSVFFEIIMRDATKGVTRHLRKINEIKAVTFVTVDDPNVEGKITISESPIPKCTKDCMSLTYNDSSIEYFDDIGNINTIMQALATQKN